MRNEDGQPKDYYARERRTSVFNCVFLVVFTLILIGVDVGMFILGTTTREMVIGIICTAVMAVVTGFVIAYHRRKFVLPKINDTETDPRKTAMFSPKDGEDVFDVCDRFKNRHLKLSMLIMASLTILVVIVICLGPSASVLGYNVPTAVMIVFYIVMLIFFAALTIKTNSQFKSSEDLRNELLIKGLDPYKVNLDFMHGSVHSLVKGFLVIGQDCYVVYTQDKVHACAINDVQEVRGVSNVEESKADNLYNNQWHAVHIVEPDGLHTFNCNSDLAIETIVDEFRKKGIKSDYRIRENDKKEPGEKRS